MTAMACVSRNMPADHVDNLLTEYPIRMFARQHD